MGTQPFAIMPPEAINRRRSDEVQAKDIFLIQEWFVSDVF
jgi:hypothetical protein